MAELPIETGVAEVQATPRRVGHRTLDLVLAICAIFISAVSLFVAIEHGDTQRELVAADTWPFVQRTITDRFGPDRDMTVGVSNDGVGPAKIRSVELFLDGRPVSSVTDLLRKCCGYRDDIPQRQQIPDGFGASLVDNTVLRAGEENIILRVRQSATAPEIPAKFRLALRRLTFRGCYCSVLDRCWQSNLSTTGTIPVETCPIPAHPYDPIGK